jgi:hypothetical protein
VLVGLCRPVVLIDLGRDPATGLRDLQCVIDRAADALVVVVDPESRRAVRRLARELGAALVLSGYVSPAFVAGLLERWIELAQRSIDREGWSRVSVADNATDPWAWLADFLGDS